jgi:hypothetical protein
MKRKFDDPTPHDPVLDVLSSNLYTKSLETDPPDESKLADINAQLSQKYIPKDVQYFPVYADQPDSWQMDLMFEPYINAKKEKLLVAILCVININTKYAFAETVDYYKNYKAMEELEWNANPSRMFSEQQECTSRSSFVSENTEEHEERGGRIERFRRTSWTSTLTYPSVIRGRGVGIQRTVCIVLCEQWDQVDDFQSIGGVKTSTSYCGEIQPNVETIDRETDQVTRSEGIEVFDTRRSRSLQSIPESPRHSEILSEESRQRRTMERDQRQSRQTSKNTVLPSDDVTPRNGARVHPVHERSKPSDRRTLRYHHGSITTGYTCTIL